MSAVQYMPDNHPEAAFAYDSVNRRMCLNNGLCVPITRYLDEDDEEVAPDDLDLYEEVQVVFGPLPSGRWGRVSIRKQPSH